MFTVTIKEFGEVLNDFFLGRSGVTVLVEGETGIGKTAAYRQLAARHKAPFVCLHPASEAQEDIAGMPDSGIVRGLELLGKKSDDWSDANILQYRMPGWFDQVLKTPKGVLLFDELNRAPRDVVMALMSLFEPNKRTLRGIKIPEGWLIGIAINPAKSGAYHVDELDPALLRRAYQFNVTFDADTWTEWAVQEKLHDSVISFARVHPELLSVSADKATDTVFPTPAGWHEISNDINAGVVKLDNITKHTELAKIAAKVGSAATLAFQKFIVETTERPVTAKELFAAKNEKVLEKFFAQQEAGKNDRMHASISDIISHISNNKLTDKVTNLISTMLKGDKMLIAYKTALLEGLHIAKCDELMAKLGSDDELYGILSEVLNGIRAKK